MLSDTVQLMKHLAETFHLMRGVLALLLFVLLLCALCLTIFEDLHYGDAVYFTAVTALTVGYGDVIPETPLGKFISVVIGFVGVIFVGIVVALANHVLSRAVEERRIEKNSVKSNSNHL